MRGVVAVGMAYGLAVWLLPLLGPTPTPGPVYDTRSDGFAAQIVPALVILGILVVAAIWTSQRPRDFKRRPPHR